MSGSEGSEEGEEEMSDEDSASEQKEEKTVNIEEESKAVEKHAEIPVPQANDEGKHCPHPLNSSYLIGYFSSIKLSELPLSEPT